MTAEQQLAWEAQNGGRAAAVAALAGVLTLGAGIYSQAAVFSGYPSVGLVQALTPALRGMRDTQTDPRASGIAFLDDKSAQLVGTSVVIGLGTVLMAYVLYYLFRAAKFRRPEIPDAARYLAIGGPIVVGLFGIVRQVLSSINSHNFVNGTDRTRDAVEAVQGSGPLLAVNSVALAGQLAIGFAFVLISLNAMRVGLLTRFMGVLGIISGVLFVLPLGSPLPIVQAFWLVALAALFLRRWPQGQPPAWLTGKAEPWPTNQQLREAREGGGDGPASLPAGAEAAADPVKPEHPSSKKRRKKRR